MESPCWEGGQELCFPTGHYQHEGLLLTSQALLLRLPVCAVVEKWELGLPAAVLLLSRCSALGLPLLPPSHFLLYREMVQPWPWASAVLESECDCFPEVVPVKGEEKKWQEV